MAFLTDLAANATEQGLNIIIYSGNDDSLVPHLGSQGKYLFSFTVFFVINAHHRSGYSGAICQYIQVVSVALTED